MRIAGAPLRLAMFFFFVIMAGWVVAPHVSVMPSEQSRLFSRIGIGLFLGGAMYLIYLALEPFVRRAWPTMLVGWSRVLRGQWRDPLVGRDILIGAASGVMLSLLTLATQVLPGLIGMPERAPLRPDPTSLFGTRALMQVFIGAMNSGLQNALITVLNSRYSGRSSNGCSRK